MSGSVNFYYDYGPQLTRSFRALKLWMTEARDRVTRLIADDTLDDGHAPVHH